MLGCVLLSNCGGAQGGRVGDTSANNRLSEAPWEDQWDRCELGYTADCLEAAAWYQGAPELWPDPSQNGPAPNPTRARLALSRACELGDRDACDWLVGQELGAGPAAVSSQARSKVERDCDRGDGLSCVIAGDSVKVRSAGRAADFYDRGCKKRAAQGCFELATLHQQGRGVPKDDARSRRLFSRACKIDRQTGCLQYAQMLLDGIGGRRNKSQARRILKRTCELDLGNGRYGPDRGWPPSCIAQDRADQR